MKIVVEATRQPTKDKSKAVRQRSKGMSILSYIIKVKHLNYEMK